MASEELDEKAIFNVARQIDSPESRREYLRQICGADNSLLGRVETLLHAYEEQASFLESSPVAGVSPTIDQPVTEKPGTQIGPYKLLQKVGEGGMGVVYMAEQKEPVKRRVALKIIKPGMDSRQVIARFEAERQALAMMDHPNIAKVLDAGQTESGRPYFVMELVNGISVTKYCDEQHLTPKERLELFVPICQAVQHAHQKGIIHRDLKPSNVLVAFYDGKPIPKVIDFGVAKATSQTLTEKTMFTQLGQVVGTLEYMSPEQAERNQLDIDTRSDIYSLGVVLYELLTGDTPFDRTRLRSAAFDEMLRIIREEEPPKPSTKLSSSDSLPSIAANRHVAPQRLSMLVRGELDWIVMKALEKDRGRRYETASKFAEDVQHYLADEPVVACPPSRAYRLKKFARRNKVALSMVSAVAVALLLGISGTIWQAIRATDAEAKVRAEADHAMREAAIAKAVLEFLNEDFVGLANPENEPDRDITLRTVVDRAAELIKVRFEGQPLVEAAVRQTIGRTYVQLGEFAEAEHHLTQTRNIREELLGPDHVESLEAATDLIKVYAWQGRSRESEELAQKTVERCRNVLGARHPLTADCLNWLGIAVRQQDRSAEAESFQREALEIAVRVYGRDHAETHFIMQKLAVTLRGQGRLAEFEELARDVLERRRRVLKHEHPDTLKSMTLLAWAIDLQGRYAEAEELHREALEIKRRVLGPEHYATLWSMQRLAITIDAQGRRAEATKLLQDALESYRRTVGEKHGRTIDCSKMLLKITSSEDE